ncbi:MAG: phenylalanine--tRNA ligase subunit beta, partial [Clostridia bacterium]|nr:phenylalanine--tRNA ligase subunit beta [Clostridia bacterium]
MNLSKKWLNDYVELDVSDKQFADDMTISGSKVEGYEKEGEELVNIVVGKVESLERHPDSDHLWICQINVGREENLQIVTGAQNLTAGDIVPVALDNSVVFGGHKIKKGKLRGVESNGMLCSLGELGLTIHDFPYAVEDGIFVLGDDCDKTLGMDIHHAIGLNDVITEFEITSNRSDCLSIIGLAREAAATFDKELKVEEPVVKGSGGDVNEILSVEIKEPEKCYRYCGAVVKNVRIKPSPRWIRERLRACGVRPINNIVDITNFVMLEYGQPMHAFDLRYLDGGKVIVRNAKEGEKITTLDDIERNLTPEMLVIADENKPVAVAGVMGGEYSGIMDDTTTIVFESACFNGVSVRRTSKALGLRTEACTRYEKELNPASCETCLKRALQLVELLDAGDVVDGIVDCFPTPKEAVKLAFEPEWVNNFIGIDVSAEEQKKMLEKIGFTVENGVITAPYFRNDIEHKADISEEIARFYGY